MHLIRKKYVIYTDKIDRDILLANSADYHYSNISDPGKFRLVLDNVYAMKPDYLAITGDFIDYPEILDNPVKYEESLLYIESLSKHSKLFFSIGSHEFVGLDKRYKLNSNWFSDLDSIPNVTVLDNSAIVCDGDINFLGYTAPQKYYYRCHNEDENILIKDFYSKMPDIDNDMYNILLCHSPRRILDDKVMESIDGLKNIDLILSGHMHNGMLPDFVSSMLKGNKGLIAPNKTLFPDNARGMVCKEVDGKEIYLNVTGGVSKIQETAPQILYFVDKMYNPQIDYIEIKSLKK